MLGSSLTTFVGFFVTTTSRSALTCGGAAFTRGRGVAAATRGAVLATSGAVLATSGAVLATSGPALGASGPPRLRATSSRNRRWSPSRVGSDSSGRSSLIAGVVARPWASSWK